MFEGVLEKPVSGFFKNKTKVWMVLGETSLTYYKNNKRSSCIGSIDVVTIKSAKQTDRVDGKEFVIKTATKSYTFIAETYELAATWVKVIQQSMSIIPHERTTDKGVYLPCELEATSPNNNDSTFYVGLADKKEEIFGVKLKSTRIPSVKQKETPGSTVNTRSHTLPLHSNTNISRAKVESGPSSECNVAMNSSSFKPQTKMSESPKIKTNPDSDLLKTQDVSCLTQNVTSLNKPPPSFQPPSPPEKSSTSKEDYKTSVASNTTVSEEYDRKETPLDTKIKTETNTHTSDKDEAFESGLCGMSEVEMRSQRKKQTNNTEVSNNIEQSACDTSPVQLRKSRRSHLTSSSAEDNSQDSRKSAKSQIQNNTHGILTKGCSKESATAPRGISELEEDDHFDIKFEYNPSFERGISTYHQTGEDLVNFLSKVKKEQSSDIQLVGPTSPHSENDTTYGAAFWKLKELLEQDSEHEFDLEHHDITNPGCIQTLREVLGVHS